MATRKAFEVEGVVSVDTRKAAQGLKDIERLAREAGRSLSSLDSAGRSASSGLLPGLSNISNIISALPTVGRLADSLVSPLRDATEQGIRFNMMMENALIGLEGIAGGADKARGFIAKLQHEAERTPFEFSGLLKSTRYMSTFGFQLDEMIPKLRSWGNVVAASGDLSEETLMGVVRAFGQMRAKGTVSAEEMEQLAERGVPSWELLAKAIGKTVEETRKLSQQGRLRGGAAVEAITAMADADPRYAGMMDRMSRTMSGRLSNLEDVRARSLGLGTQNLTKDLSDALGAGLSQANLAENMAGKVNAAIAPLSGVFKAAVVGAVGGGITGGVKEGIDATAGIVFDAVRSMGLGSIKTLMDVLDAHSPSREFMKIGEMAGEGYFLGLTGALKKFDFGPEIEKIILEAAKKYDLDPNLIRAVIFKESRGRTRAVSPVGAKGLMQIMPETGKSLGLRQDEFFDPQKNVMAGAKYLAQLLEKFNGRLDLALAGYNSGPHRKSYARAMETGSEINWSGLPVGVQRETKPYVQQILQYYDQLRGKSVAINVPMPVKVVGWDGAAQLPFTDSMARHIEDKGFGAGGLPVGTANPGALALAGLKPGDTSSAIKRELDTTAADFELLKTLGQIGPTIEQGFEQGGAAAGSFYESVVKQAASGEEQLKSLLETLKTDSRLNWMTIAEDGQQIFSNFFLDLQNGWKGALGNMGLAFLESLNSMAAHAAASAVWSWILNAVGMAVGGASGGGGMGSTGSMAGIAALIPGRAAGGPVSANNMYLVGERGPEFFVPKQSGTIIPNGAGGPAIHVTMHNTWQVHPGAQSLLSRESESQAAERLARRVEAEMLRRRG